MKLNLLNVVYRLLYAYTILYKRSGDRIPNLGEGQKFTHDETRGCLFDMNGIKTDIVASCHRPIICDECEENLKRDKVSTDTIDTAKKEILKIRKDLYYRLADFLRNHPLWAITISSLFAILLGTTSSVLASFVYDKIR